MFLRFGDAFERAGGRLKNFERDYARDMLAQTIEYAWELGIEVEDEFVKVAEIETGTDQGV